MLTLFDGEIEVHYGFANIGSCDPATGGVPRGGPPDWHTSVHGQSNGILGGAVPGWLLLLMGLHTGTAPLRVQWSDTEPPLPGDEFKDVVEASFTPASADLRVWTFQDVYPVLLPLVADLRVRYSISGMDRGREVDVREPEEPGVEQGLLHLWPAPSAPDAVLRSGSVTGRGWHEQVPRVPAG